MNTEPQEWRRPDADAEYFHKPPQMRQDMLDRAVAVLAREGARDWFWRAVALLVITTVLSYTGLFLFGFDNVMDRMGFVLPACVEQIETSSP